MQDATNIPIRLKRTVSSDVPGPVREAAEEAASRGEAFIMRYTATVYRPLPRSHVQWSGLAWILEVPGLVEAELVQETVGAFFQAVQTGRIHELNELLEAFRRPAQEQVS